MAIRISPEIQARITEIAEQGDYESIDTILDEALTLLEERRRFQHLKALIGVGTEQIARGEVIPYTEELLEEIKQSALRRFDADEVPGPDVCP